MKAKTLTVVLTLICLGLGAGLWYRHHTAVAQKRADDEQIRLLAQQVAEKENQLHSQLTANSNLSAAIQAKGADLDKTLAQLTETRGLLGKTQADIETARQELDSTKAEVNRRDGRIAELETANAALDHKASELQAAITDLESRIADTQKRLDASEGNRSFLLKELKRLQAEKTDLERRFSDLAELRQQIKKAKEELVISRRMDWMRRGLYDTMQKSGAGTAPTRVRRSATSAKPDVDLNVEIRRDGPATVVPPVNAPPGTTRPQP